MNRNFLITIILFFLIPNFLFADTVLFLSGRTLKDIKIKVRRDTAEIFFANGKQEIRNKSEIKSIKLFPVTWDPKFVNQNKKPIIEKPRKNLQVEMEKLEQIREQSFAIAPKILEERKRHDHLLKERIRLQFTEGFLSYAGGQVIYTEIMSRNNDRYYVKNEYGLLYFTSKDFGDEMSIETDNGKEKIDISKILAVKEEKYVKGYVYLTSGEKFLGKIEKKLGNQVLLSTNKGLVKVLATEVLFPEVSKELIVTENFNIKEGESGQFLFISGQIITGKLIKLTKNYMLIDTAYGNIEVNPSNLISATKDASEK